MNWYLSSNAFRAVFSRIFLRELFFESLLEFTKTSFVLLNELECAPKQYLAYIRGISYPLFPNMQNAALKEVFSAASLLKDSTKQKERKVLYSFSCSFFFLMIHGSFFLLLMFYHSNQDALKQLRSLLEVGVVVLQIDECTLDELHQEEVERKSMNLCILFFSSSVLFFPLHWSLMFVFLKKLQYKYHGQTSSPVWSACSRGKLRCWESRRKRVSTLSSSLSLLLSSSILLLFSQFLLFIPFIFLFYLSSSSLLHFLYCLPVLLSSCLSSSCLSVFQVLIFLCPLSVYPAPCSSPHTHTDAPTSKQMATKKELPEALRSLVKLADLSLFCYCLFLFSLSLSCSLFLYVSSLSHSLSLPTLSPSIGGPRLFVCVRELLQHIVDVIEDDYLCTMFLTDYNHMLLESILCVSGYCHLISRQLYNGVCFLSLCWCSCLSCASVVLFVCRIWMYFISPSHPT